MSFPVIKAVCTCFYFDIISCNLPTASCFVVNDVLAVFDPFKKSFNSFPTVRDARSKVTGGSTSVAGRPSICISPKSQQSNKLSGRPVGRVVGRWDEWSAGGTSGRPVGRVVGRWDEWSAGGTSGRPVGRVVGRWDEWSAGGTSGRPVGRVVGRWDEWYSMLGPKTKQIAGSSGSMESDWKQSYKMFTLSRVDTCTQDKQGTHRWQIFQLHPYWKVLCRKREG
ncbi:uncharacterized protein LOC133142947 isoform X2 [Syngnathus typhle]|uniref:uncharacterized protein LOC133142947 isoform X2 n=1 Tax=Syngnathus typhle TaxID=161592 RepID=UPI002A6A6FE5|nr:uncharacterized protein LOC133142947 isoform X2 [Syngnathus typhle]